MRNMELSDAKKMKAADEAAICDGGMDSKALMERAARELLKAAVTYMEPGKHMVVFAGPGNNGGDGLALARLFRQMDAAGEARVLFVGNREKMTPDTRAMEEKLLATGGQVEPFVPGDSALGELCAGAGVIVDAIFGIGLSRELSGDALAAVELINASGAPVVSADIPSGVSADSGRILGAAVAADCTVTFSRAKPGHFLEPGCVCRGELRVADIGIPEELCRKAGCGLYAIRGEDLHLPFRKPISHKGDYGKLLIVGGSIPYTGAPTLAAKAAVRGGAGLVYLGVPSDIYEIEAVKNQEAIVFPLASGEKGRVSRRAWDSVAERLKACDVCVLGPGMGRGEDTRAITALVLKNSGIPVLADADALWAIAEDTSMLDGAACPVVLTPHEGEFQRLLGRPVEDRVADARGYAKAHRCAVVLKGHRTVCAFPDGKAYIIDAGNPGMAKGGTGDVLAGVLGAMLCQMSFRRAIVTGCWLHARAGDLAEKRFGEYAMQAGDMIECLTMAELEILR